MRQDHGRLLLAPDSMYVEQSLERVTKDAKLDSTQVDSVRGLIVRRAEKKAAWALKELKALQTIQERKVMDVAQLKGSWAGAFGFPQFLPSSYNSWAVDGDADGIIDLYNLPDAGHSIGNYLKDNGWSDNKTSQRKAVHHYNNSDAYVDAVFTLASKVR
jgi:membrane-bound lytic murein transglycosylase B